jgi:Family of unknown function (DUF6510)
MIMEALDGNAIAGQLFEYFGREMTTAVGTCAHCGAPATLAELVVYVRAPGAVVRCRHCGDVVIVLVNARGTMRVAMDDFHLLGPARGRADASA